MPLSDRRLNLLRRLILLGLSLWLAPAALAATAEINTQTAIRAEDLDPDASADWVGGVERPRPPASSPRPWVWTRNELPESSVKFGDSQQPGPRHCRIGFKSPVAVGSVMVRGGGVLSVLHADAGYPGDLTRESDWLPAERVVGGAVSRDEVAADELAVWVLPPATRTRALRFSHVARAADPSYAGIMNGALVLADRVVNIAPQAIVSASARDESAGLINNGKAELWNAWDDGAEGAAHAISPEHPQWLMLTWPRPVPLCALETLWTGFGSATVQVYAGPADKHPREAADADWQTVRQFDKLQSGYTFDLWPNAMVFGRTIATRAVRVLITSPTPETHPHLSRKTKEGRRVWLGELMALRPLGDEPLQSAVAPVETVGTHPPIPVRFKLSEPGYVTLVIEDAQGKRVRNLVSGVWFAAGDNVAWWDGADDLGRDTDAARHGLYHIPEQPVAPGTYRVRGLFHAALDLRYEFSIYTAGRPAWATADTSGGWLTNHTPPSAVVFVPADKTPNGDSMIYIGSAVSEGGAGLAWVDQDGKKRGGRGWIGGNWTAAPTLARDEGPHAVPEIFAYVGATWTSSANNRDRTHGELRITGLTARGDKAILKYPFTPPDAGKSDLEGDNTWIAQLGGIAVHDGILVASFNKLGTLLFVDCRSGKALGEAAVPDPRGLAFDNDGRLLVLSGARLLRFALDAGAPQRLPRAQTLIDAELLDPQDIVLDPTGRFCVSDGGESQQVKIFSANGRLLTSIGHAGALRAGPYDPLHMSHPRGLAIDARQQLWVAENDFQPKRVSVWTLDGKLVRALYGPSRYGGGGSLDPRDKTRFYYDGMEFRLDWATGSNEPVSIISREGKDDISSQFRSAPPQTPIYVGGRQYMTNCYNSNPTGGAAISSIWRMERGIAIPAAAMGRAEDWKLLKSEAFKPRWPTGVDLNNDKEKNGVLFIWNDLNGDGRVQPDEVTMEKASSGGVTVGADLAITDSRVDEFAMRFAPTRFTPAGVPVYDLASGQVLTHGAQAPASSGGDQVLVSPEGWTVLTVAPQPYAREGFGGVKNGKALWSYPSAWPGLHASHEAPVATEPGEVIGSTRLLGDFVTPRNSDAGPLWCINGNMGDMYLLTADGLFVSQLFEDARVGKPWSMPTAERGMSLNGVSLSDENFFPTITQTLDGAVYLCDGGRSSLVRVDGLESIRRLSADDVQLTPDDLVKANTWRFEAEAQRQAARGTGTLVVAVRKQSPAVDGRLDGWADADWAVIDRRGVAANFNSDSKPYDVSAALGVSGDRLYAVFKTQDADLLKNSGQTPDAPFKTGGCLDLMLGTDPAADPKRQRPQAGDERLLVTQVQGRTLALLYRAVVPGTREPVPFSSPWRTITIDQVTDISEQVQLGTNIVKNDRGHVESAVYAFSVPLAALGMKVADGLSIRGDIGILRGNGFQTMQRTYWNNKATAITADVPSEAEITPGLWGRWQFKIDKAN